MQAAQQIPQARFQDHRGNVHAKMPAWNAPLGGKNVLVLGSEAHGIHEELLAECDERVLIPLEGKVSSLNAAVQPGFCCMRSEGKQAFQLEIS